MRVVGRHDCTVLMVGDSRAGKTALATRFRTGKFEERYSRTGFESRGSSIVMQGKRIKFTIYDTTGHHGQNSQREVAYREADVFLLCYKISDPSSLFSAINHWVPELRQHAPATPILLVGCAEDLRNDRAVLQSLAKHGRSCVSPDQARSLSQQMGALGCVQTSAKTSCSGPQQVFELAAKISLEQCSTSESTSPSDTLERTTNNDDQFWEQGTMKSSGSGTSFSRSASLSSSLNSTRSSLSLPRTCSPLLSHRSLSLRTKPAPCPNRMVTITVQRLNQDKIYEEVEIEVPAPIFETLQACNDPTTMERRKESLGSRLKQLFLRD